MIIRLSTSIISRCAKFVKRVTAIFHHFEKNISECLPQHKQRDQDISVQPAGDTASHRESVVGKKDVHS